MLTLDRLDRLARRVVEEVDNHRQECGAMDPNCTVLNDVRNLIEEELENG